MHRVLLPIIVCLGLLSGPVPAADCDGCDRSLAPRLWIPDGDPALDQLPLKSSHAEIRIDGPIAQVRVTQRYGNAGTRPINARYVFPGSTRAAVHGLTMRIGERVIRAEIKEKGDKQIMDILTPQQQEKFKALQKEFERGCGPKGPEGERG